MLGDWVGAETEAGLASRVGFLAAAIGAAIALAACGGPPTAKEILAKPANSDLKDAHVKITGHFTSGAISIDMTGDGVILLKPKSASDIRLQGSLGAIPIAIESLSVDGKDYQRTGSEKWTVSEGKSSVAWSDAKDASLIGEESLPEGKAWHVKGTGSDGKPFELWVRESDGYPLKASASIGENGTMTMVFDKFNTGAKVSAPVASELKPAAKSIKGKVGTAVALNSATVTVVSVDLDYKSSDQFTQPKAGNRFVAVEILYENTGADKVSYNPFDWKLSDSSGFSYEHGYSGKGPELNSGDLAAGEKARGFITYEVPQGATGLSLKLSLGDDSLTVALG